MWGKLGLEVVRRGIDPGRGVIRVVLVGLTLTALLVAQTEPRMDPVAQPSQAGDLLAHSRLADAQPFLGRPA